MIRKLITLLQIRDLCVGQARIAGREDVLGNIIKIRPPIVFRKEYADTAIATIDRALGRV